MEAIYAAGACWYSEQRPNPPLLRPSIASEVSTAEQEEKHLRTSWSYNWRAAPDNDGGVVRVRWTSRQKPPHIRSRVSATCGSTKPTSASFDRRLWASDRLRLINWWQKSASLMGEPKISMFGLLDFLMPAGKMSSELCLNTSHLQMLTWRPSGGPTLGAKPRHSS